MNEPLGTCDRDAGTTRAVVRVRLPSGLELEFCSHHYDQHKDKLGAVEIVADEREALYTAV